MVDDIWRSDETRGWMAALNDAVVVLLFCCCSLQHAEGSILARFSMFGRIGASMKGD